jgi:hypothetical protein
LTTADSTLAMSPAGSAREGEGIVDPLPLVRQTVRSLLLASPAFQELDPPRQRRLAEAMVRVCSTAASLIREEIDSERRAWTALDQAPPATPLAAEPDQTNAPVSSAGGEPLAQAQAAGQEFSGVAAERVAGTTRAILNAVSFPRFVTELINGVFKAMLDSDLQQMNAYVELLNNVAASTEGFAAANLGADRARTWLAERYPASFEVVGPSSELDGPGEESGDQSTLQLRAGASMPPAPALRTDLGLGDDEPVPISDPERVLVPLAQRRLAKMRQEMLATMVLLGMQRIVVESGRIHASMRFHIDTRSAAHADQGSTLDVRNQVNASGSFGYGPWGASAAVSNTIGYVSTQRSQTTEEMNTDLDLNSSVEINFKSDYLPWDRLATPGQARTIRENSRNPSAEQTAGRAETPQERATRAAQSDEARRREIDARLNRPAPIPAPSPGAPGTIEAAEQARARANREAAARPRTGARDSRSAQPNAENRSQSAQSNSENRSAAPSSSGAPNAQPARNQETRAG